MDSENISEDYDRDASDYNDPDPSYEAIRISKRDDLTKKKKNSFVQRISKEKPIQKQKEKPKKSKVSQT